MTNEKSSWRISLSALTLMTLIAVLLFPQPAHAQTKKKKAKKKTPDRELALQLSKSLGVAAAEGQRFAEVRDTLAQARLRSTQRREENLIDLQESRSLRLHAWEVIGETYRLKLFDGVLTATEEVVRRRDEERQRRARQRQVLAQTKSKVNIKSKQLLSAATGLAALAEPPKRGDASELFSQLVREITGSPDVRTAILDAATTFVQKQSAESLEDVGKAKEAAAAGN